MTSGLADYYSTRYDEMMEIYDILLFAVPYLRNKEHICDLILGYIY